MWYMCDECGNPEPCRLYVGATAMAFIPFKCPGSDNRTCKWVDIPPMEEEDENGG